MKRINWNEPRFDAADIKAITKVLQSNYINEGEKTKELEEKLKKYLGVKYVIMTTSGTAALFLAIKADKIVRNLKEFEVIIPDLTMIATATSVDWAGGNVALADVDIDRFTIDVEEVKRKINSRTSAIIPVHVLGRAAPIEELLKVAKEKNLIVIEDACGALGSKHNGKYLGTFGKVGCFSLQSNKIITCGQGGFAVTNDERYYAAMKQIKDFGRIDNKSPHQIAGYNLKFNDLSAALVLSQFKKIEERKKILMEQYKRYKRKLCLDLVFPKLEDGEIPLWIDVQMICNKAIIFLMNYLNANQIFPRECWKAIHRNQPYKYLGNDRDYPNASSISEDIIWLPNGFGITNKEIDYVCNKITEFFNDKRL